MRVGVCSILERKALIDVNAHLPERIALLYPTRAHRHRPLSSSEPRDRPSAEFAAHEAYGFPQKHELADILMQVMRFHYFIILTIIVPFKHDSVSASPISRTRPGTITAHPI
jgi:hypothetical protein